MNDNVIFKAGKIAGQEASAEEMALINQYTLRELTPEEVFTFRVTACDNEVDRDFEVFPAKTLKALAEMFIGKTMISDHEHTSENQCARVYAAEVVHGEGTTKNGEPYSRLEVKCYMVRTDDNKAMITDIEAGIKKEVSVACRMGAAVCSICGTDNRRRYCEHMPGREYDGKSCFFRLENPQDAYEISFVAVPAQPAAGVTKNYGGDPQTADNSMESIRQKSRMVDSFLFTEREGL